MIRILPLGKERRGEQHTEPAALVTITDPDAEPVPQPQLWHRLYGFTKTESEVASQVMQGASPRDIASELCVSLSTVRTHLQHIFEKTKTHRQGELVRLLLALGH
ncbi:helix-turn-helix transcriptional regulator [Mycobacterium sp. CPCC 205372]|uniref:Helix-turn-helix transcriptional regulator n=1 Tax=Mycobacterium hippophais TaxID=3016340 RepID=A0ABT4PVT6_9MYCO|nr:helix-turn-helix transcriptional regulator [Mycobacterium hippophais]MCZ8380666.1 helix-turn-helix transcriptional regulator [Mycobacterium hippophais]